jgi:REP element-mobilizing transposase RayT
MNEKSKYNPNIHHRRSIRLKGYDYSQAGLYFITICCQDRICRFGKIENGEMILNQFGQIAYNEWTKLVERFPNMELDVFQIMPNHIHGIILLNDTTVGAGFTPALNNPQSNIQNGQTIDGQPNIHNGQPQGIAPAQNDGQPQGIAPAQNDGQPQGIAPTVSDIVGAYKSLVANGCLEIYKSNNDTMGKLWQRNYREHIIRNEQSYHNISEYIMNNPAKWNEDKFYTI